MNALELKQKTTKELIAIAEEHGLKSISRQKNLTFFAELEIFKLKTKVS